MQRYRSNYERALRVLLDAFLTYKAGRKVDEAALRSRGSLAMGDLCSYSVGFYPRNDMRRRLGLRGAPMLMWLWRRGDGSRWVAALRLRLVHGRPYRYIKMRWRSRAPGSRTSCSYIVLALWRKRIEPCQSSTKRDNITASHWHWGVAMEQRMIPVLFCSDCRIELITGQLQAGKIIAEDALTIFKMLDQSEVRAGSWFAR